MEIGSFEYSVIAIKVIHYSNDIPFDKEGIKTLAQKIGVELKDLKKFISLYRRELDRFINPKSSNNI